VKNFCGASIRGTKRYYFHQNRPKNPKIDQKKTYLKKKKGKRKKQCADRL